MAVPSSTASRPTIAAIAGGLFFPQRLLLKLDTHGYSRAILKKIVEAGGQLKSFELAARLLKSLAEFSISGRHVGRLTHAIGEELQATRDQQTEEWIHCRAQPRVESVPPIAAVFVDGGRIQTREAGHGPGVHGHGWKEDKIGCLLSMEGPRFAEDPQPQPPACFLDHRYVADLVRDLKSKNGLASKDPDEALPGQPHTVADPKPAEEEPSAWPPQRLVRTCVATQQNSQAFGMMVAAEAHARQFEAADRRAFLGDGELYNWTIQQRWFKDYTAITDFIHPLAYLYLAAAAVTTSLAERWTCYSQWMTSCWQGEVDQVLNSLRECQERLGSLPTASDSSADDPRLAIKAAITYLTNNQPRMNYPRYRREGLPITSSAVESLIKEFNYRVKGTEKFWNTPQRTESILQVRSALLSGDDRMSRHLANRPGSAFRIRPAKPKTREAAAAA